MLMWGQNGPYIKKDWTPDRIGRAHRSTHTTTKAEEFAQLLLMPRVPALLMAPRPVAVHACVDRLVEFLNR